MTAQLRDAAVLQDAAVLHDALARVDEEWHETVLSGEHCIVTRIDSMRHGRRVQRRREFFLASGWYDLVVGGDDHRGRHGDVLQPWSRIERTDFASRLQDVSPVVAGNLASSPVGQLVRLALQVDLFGDPRPGLSARQFGQSRQAGETEEIEALVA